MLISQNISTCVYVHDWFDGEIISLNVYYKSLVIIIFVKFVNKIFIDTLWSKLGPIDLATLKQYTEYKRHLLKYKLRKKTNMAGIIKWKLNWYYCKIIPDKNVVYTTQSNSWITFIKDGLMVIMFTLREINRGFETWSGQTNDNKISFLLLLP